MSYIADDTVRAEVEALKARVAELEAKAGAVKAVAEVAPDEDDEEPAKKRAPKHAR